MNTESLTTKSLLDDGQIAAIEKLTTGKILCGGLGTGKTRTSLGYYHYKVCSPDYKPPLVVITTAKVRDSKAWQTEAAQFGIDEITVDSWNRIKHYSDYAKQFFIFDEQHVTGSGPWVKAFLRITRNNDWILLSATPGDSWIDYLPVFMANGFYKTRYEFTMRHVVYKPFVQYRQIIGYRDEGILQDYLDSLLVDIEHQRNTIRHDIVVRSEYNRDDYKWTCKYRKKRETGDMLLTATDLCLELRRIVNTDESKQYVLQLLCSKHDRIIVFYTFDYELDILKSVQYPKEYKIAEYNGHKHEPLPDSEKWIYLVNYIAGQEGWNCVETDVILFYSQTYSYRCLEQAKGRIDRRNTKYTDLYYYHLISDAPIDKAIKRSLDRKENFNEAAFSRIK